MALIEFKDLPDKSTPLNSANLNNNFNELKNGIDDLSENLKNNSTFSTEEKIIGTFTDGKPIYRQTILGAINDASIIKSGVDTLVNAYGTIFMNGNTRPINYYELYNNYQYFWNLRVASNNIYMACIVAGKSYNTNDARITIEYTKTTD